MEENQFPGFIVCLVLCLAQIMQTIGFIGPAFFLTRLSHIDSPAMAVLCMACSQVCGIMLFSNYKNPQAFRLSSVIQKEVLAYLLFQLFIIFLSKFCAGNGCLFTIRIIFQPSRYCSSLFGQYFLLISVFVDPYLREGILWKLYWLIAT